MTYNIFAQLQFIMKIQKYLSIPKDSLKRKRYICLLKIFISAASSVLIISLKKIFVPLQTNLTLFKIVPILLVTTLIKIFFNINYLCKKGNYIKSRLQQKAQLQIKSIILPTFTKLIFFIGLVYSAINIYRMDIIIAAWINFVFIQYYKVKVDKQEFAFKNWMIAVLLSIALIITPLNYNFQLSLLNNLFILTFGCLSLLSFYSLHSDIFKVYQTPVQELIAKQNLVQLGILLCACTLFLFTNSNIQEWTYIKFNIGYILMIGLVVFVYDYVIFEIIKKTGYGELLQTQLTAIMWVNIYTAISKGDLTIRMYFSSLLFAIILITTSHLVQIKDIKKLVNYLQKKKVWKNSIQLNDDFQ